MYATFAAMSMMRPLVIRITESHREQNGKMCLPTGYALSAEQARKNSLRSKHTGRRKMALLLFRISSS